MKRTEDEIQDQVALTYDHPNIYPGMTYADGIQAALLWVTGERDELPIDEEDM